MASIKRKNQAFFVENVIKKAHIEKMLGISWKILECPNEICLSFEENKAKRLAQTSAFRCYPCIFALLNNFYRAFLFY